MPKAKYCCVSKENHSEAFYCGKHPCCLHSSPSWPDTEASRVEHCLSSHPLNKKGKAKERLSLQTHLRHLILIFKKREMIEGDERGIKWCLFYISDEESSLNPLAGYYAFLCLACHSTVTGETHPRSYSAWPLAGKPDLRV